MANFNLTITNEGAAFLADIIANQGMIDFTEVRFSSANYVGSEATLTEGTFAGTFITATPTASVLDSTTINVASSFDNSSFTSDKVLYSIGIIAEDGNGNIALVAVCTTSSPDTIPQFVLTTSVYAFNINLSVSSTQNITVTASGAGVVFVSDIVNNLTSSETNKPLSAAMGRELALKTSGLSNDNLLDNPFFTINQRGQSSYTTKNTYSVDRWCIQAGSSTDPSVTVNVDGTITVTNGSGVNSPFYLTQFVEGTFGDGVTDYTASAIVTAISGTVILYCGSGTGQMGVPITRTGITSVTGKPTNTASPNVIARLVVSPNSSVTVKAVKVERGTISTIGNDEKPDYAMELAKCQTSTADSNDTYANQGNLVTSNSIAPTEDGATASKAYALGAYFYRGGNICRCLSDISSGATLTLNTNYENVIRIPKPSSEYMKLTFTSGSATISNAKWENRVFAVIAAATTYVLGIAYTGSNTYQVSCLSNPTYSGDLWAYVHYISY